MTNCRMEENVAVNEGAAIYIESSVSAVDMTVTDSTLRNNGPSSSSSEIFVEASGNNAATLALDTENKNKC
jgi:hypothetical protein